MAGEQEAGSTTGQKEPAFAVKSGLVASVEKILRRALTAEEVQHWNSIQDQYGIADDDPLVVLLTVLALHQHLFNDLPKRIQEATDKAIAVHRTTLEEQATIVSKALLAKLSPMFVQAAREANGGSAGGFGLQLPVWITGVVGLACGGIGAWLWHFIGR
jgi:hypothetical protein